MTQGVTPPKHILIVGGGEFGLSTALALLHRSQYAQSQITVLESSSILPNPAGSSVDASRIIRADYAHISYAALASQAQVLWRDTSDDGWGGEGRYSETGFVLTANHGLEAYVDEALANVRSLAHAGLPIDIDKIEQLHDKDALTQATRYGGVSGDKGYANWNSGWAHAEKVVRYVIRKLAKEGAGRVVLRAGASVQKLLVENGTCQGVLINAGEQTEEVRADQIILATGAWTSGLLDLEGRCLATGHPIAYLEITEEEQAQFGERPVIMNLSNGMFIIPPVDRELKIARHTYGYLHPQTVEYHNGTRKEQVSVPKAGATVPEAGQVAFRAALQEIVPWVADRPFIKTRICWYTDTPDGNFLIDHHPHIAHLLLATGGSGHGFKFFPVIGDKIVDRLEHRLDEEFAQLWSWKAKAEQFTGCDDGSRSGHRGETITECTT